MCDHCLLVLDTPLNNSCAMRIPGHLNLSKSLLLFGLGGSTEFLHLLLTSLLGNRLLVFPLGLGLLELVLPELLGGVLPIKVGLLQLCLLEHERLNLLGGRCLGLCGELCFRLALSVLPRHDVGHSRRPLGIAELL